MSLRFICIEVRRNLLCANIFLQFAENLTDTEFLKINIEEQTISLREYSTETKITLNKHFTMKVNTISNLIVKESNASFRINIDNIVDNEEGATERMLGQATPQFVENSDIVSVHCSNCKCNLTSAKIFQRVREFPSGSIDMSEFFCHNGPDFNEVLVPQLTDFYYGFLFLVLNMDLLQSTTKDKKSHIYCRRCLQYLGEKLLSGKAAKLWTDTLLLNCNDVFKDIFYASSDKYATYTCQLLHKIIRESTVSYEPFLHQMHFSKVILIASLPNRQCKYLLLHILEKQLEVLRNANPLVHGSCHNGNVLQVQLEAYKCFKLLYLLADENVPIDESEATDNETLHTKTLLATWQKDISIHSLKISPTLFTDLVRELEDNSLLLPDLYRYAQDNFQLSYIFYKN